MVTPSQFWLSNMKIYLKSNDGFNLKLWLPTSFLKRKFMMKFITQNVDFSEQVNALLPRFYDELKKFIKQNGPFTLVDITSADGEKVMIKI